MSREKRELIRRYDSTADLYDRRYAEIQKRKIEYISEYLSDSDVILDVGCGTGIFLELIGEKKAVIGLDFSLEMLNRGRGRVDDKSLVVGDADILPFKNSTFDAVVSLTLLQNMPMPERTVSEMSRVVKTGGRIILTVLEKKYSVKEVENWLISDKLKVVDSGKIPSSEDVFCIGERIN